MEKTVADKVSISFHFLIIIQNFIVDRLDLALHRQQRSFELAQNPADQRFGGALRHRQLIQPYQPENHTRKQPGLTPAFKYEYRDGVLQKERQSAITTGVNITERQSVENIQ